MAMALQPTTLSYPLDVSQNGHDHLSLMSCVGRFGTRDQVDEEIMDLERRLCSLRKLRNNFVPILALPPELLMEIFLYNTCDVGFMSDSLDWTKVAHVCRYFRAVALQCPRLWSRITIRSQPWVAEMIKRSKSVPLTLHCIVQNISHRRGCSGIEEGAEEMERVCELAVLPVKSVPLMQRLWDLFTRSAPVLQSFTVVRPQNSYEAGPTSHIPPGLFHGDTPSLRQLELRQCTWCWSSTLFCNSITSLTLDGRKVRMRPRVEEILGALERMPMLEVTVLDQITPDIPWDFYPASGQGQVLRFAHLKYLFIDGLALNCATLLYHLDFPPSARLNLCCQPFSKYEEFFTVARAIATKYPSSDDGPDNSLRSFTFVPSTMESLQLRAWTTTISVEELRHKPSTDPSLDLRLAWDGAALANSVKSLMYACKALPLRTVRTLYVPDYVSLSARSWIETFGLMVSVEELWISGRTANHLPSALRKTLTCTCGMHQNENGEAQSLFPVLRALRLEEVDFSGDACPEASFFWQLQEYVIDRCATRREDIQLYVYNCKNFILEQFEDLEQIGAKVHWNGRELLDFDLSEVESDDSEEDYEDYYDHDDEDDEDQYTYVDVDALQGES